MISYEEYLRGSAVPRDVIDLFLDSSKLPWARFDRELGYVLGNSSNRQSENKPAEPLDRSGGLSILQGALRCGRNSGEAP